MELRDFLVTPLVVLLVLTFGYVVRPLVTDATTRSYFFPGLLFKMIGAVAVGLVYQFYYASGDTIIYHTHGSRVLWETFWNDPALGIKAFFSHGTYGPGLWDIGDKIWYWRDPQAFLVIQISTLFDLLTFSTYSATAVLFAVLSFTGGWMLFLTFYEKHPQVHRNLAVATLFIPSVLFWGSGILKDTVTFAFVGIATYCFSKIVIDRKFTLSRALLLLLSLFIIFSVKKYILLCFLAALMVWATARYLSAIHPPLLRYLTVPLVGLISVGITYYAINSIAQDDPRYALNRISETAMITAYDIRYWTGKDAGSGYSLGSLDGTWQSMLRLAPGAINASLFRPYLWEVNNPLMLLSALESLLFLFITLWVLWRTRTYFFKFLTKPDVLFCMVFAILFAFAVGVSTFNFGTLSRYKIPMMPFYLVAIILVHHFSSEYKRAHE